MSQNEGTVLFIGISIAFILVEYRPRIKLFQRKPFNCVKCMTGWCSLGVAYAFEYGWHSLWFFPLGIFVGAMFEAVRMRWL